MNYSAPRSATWQLLANAVLIIVLVFGAMLAGLITSFAGLYGAALLVAIVLLIAGMLLPLNFLFPLIILIVYLAVGQLQYFARVDKAFWIPYLLGLFLFLRLIAFKVTAVNSRGDRKNKGATSSILFALFFLTAIASSLISTVSPLQWFVAGKEYFFLWSIPLAFMMRAIEPDQFQRLFKWVPWFLLLQFPVVLYQRFVVAARRSGDSAFDAVVGLFGGNPNGGGASGAMAIFSVMVIAFVFEGWKQKRFSGAQVCGLVGLAISPLLFAEVKFVLFLLPLVMVMVFGAGFMQRPLKGLLGLAFGVAFAILLILVYQFQFLSSRSEHGKSITAYVETIVERNSNSEFIKRNGEMGRVAALTFWAREQSWGNPAGVLIGHGIGSTRVGGLVTGELPQKYRFRPGRSTLAIFLWETGLIGTLSIIGALSAVALRAFRMAKTDTFKHQGWILRGCGIGVFITLLAFPYNTDFVEVSQIQILVLMMIGYVLALGAKSYPRKRFARHGVGRAV